jgi:hypothetical protein
MTERPAKPSSAVGHRASAEMMTELMLKLLGTVFVVGGTAVVIDGLMDVVRG